MEHNDIRRLFPWRSLRKRPHEKTRGRGGAARANKKAL
jgi:hypothetical protein